ncbi:MAG TPA: VOC family protein [Verrucomicrobiae bacterium]|nr:VOC family protein [Verrucomicrobiae bacterium]
MGILGAAKPVAIICTRDRARAAVFYRDTLGLKLKSEDDYAVVFDVDGVDLRVSTVPDFTPHEHTVFGFRVPEVSIIVEALREHGVMFNTYKGFNQDDLGIWSLPNSTLRVAWFNDPDGNVLSVTNA